jgi:hypothetical protein
MVALKAKAEAEIALMKQAGEKELERQLEMQKVALTGTTEEMIALQKQQEKEQRVEHLAQKAIRRIGNQGIMRGFSAWQEQYLEAARHKRMLAAAGARLARPQLAAAVAHWRADWDAALLQAERSKRKSVTGTSKQQMEEMEQMKRQLAAAQAEPDERAESAVRSTLIFTSVIFFWHFYARMHG